ncbi:hypothetical protein O0L34_g865 [Tuta absoluta]|nr:hypothetical protein O0L34_g865 [Tuta absoluta]
MERRLVGRAGGTAGGAAGTHVSVSGGGGEAERECVRLLAACVRAPRRCVRHNQSHILFGGPSLAQLRAVLLSSFLFHASGYCQRYGIDFNNIFAIVYDFLLASV